METYCPDIKNYPKVTIKNPSPKFCLKNEKINLKIPIPPLYYIQIYTNKTIELCVTLNNI